MATKIDVEIRVSNESPGYHFKSDTRVLLTDVASRDAYVEDVIFKNTPTIKGGFNEITTMEASINIPFDNVNDVKNTRYVEITVDGFKRYYTVVAVEIRNTETATLSLTLDHFMTHFPDIKFNGTAKVDRWHRDAYMMHGTKLFQTLLDDYYLNDPEAPNTNKLPFQTSFTDTSNDHTKDFNQILKDLKDGNNVDYIKAKVHDGGTYHRAAAFAWYNSEEKRKYDIGSIDSYNMVWVYAVVFATDLQSRIIMRDEEMINTDVAFVPVINPQLAKALKGSHPLKDVKLQVISNSSTSVDEISLDQNTAEKLVNKDWVQGFVVSPWPIGLTGKMTNAAQNGSGWGNDFAAVINTTIRDFDDMVFTTQDSTTDGVYDKLEYSQQHFSYVFKDMLGQRHELDLFSQQQGVWNEKRIKINTAELTPKGVAITMSWETYPGFPQVGVNVEVIELNYSLPFMSTAYAAYASKNSNTIEAKKNAIISNGVVGTLSSLGSAAAGIATGKLGAIAGGLGGAATRIAGTVNEMAMFKADLNDKKYNTAGTLKGGENTILGYVNKYLMTPTDNPFSLELHGPKSGELRVLRSYYQKYGSYIGQYKEIDLNMFGTRENHIYFRAQEMRKAINTSVLPAEVIDAFSQDFATGILFYRPKKVNGKYEMIKDDVLVDNKILV